MTITDSELDGTGVAAVHPASQARARVPARRITIIVSFANVAGAQIAALRLARGLRERGHQTEVLFLYQQEALTEPDHPFDVLLPKAQVGARGYLTILRRLTAHLRKTQPDVVLTFLPLASVLGQVSALASGIKQRVVSHRTPANTAKRSLFVLDGLWARLGIYTKVVAVSAAVAETCAHYPQRLKRQMVVINNGIRGWVPSKLSREGAREKFAIPHGVRALIAVGRMMEQKNYPLMISLMSDLPDCLLLLAGDGRLRPELEAKVEALGVGDRVRLLGNVARADVPDLLQAADLFIQTSTFEGQSNSVLEALLAARPVLVHDVPEQRDTVVDENGEVPGALVPLNDREAWLREVKALLADDERRKRAERIAANRSTAFRYETMIDKFEDVLAPV